MKEVIGKNSIELFEIIKEFNSLYTKKDMRLYIVNYFYVNKIRDIEIIDKYLTFMKLNLERKNYTFSTYCIKNLEDSKKTYDEILEYRFQNTGKGPYTHANLSFNHIRKF